MLLLDTHILLWASLDSTDLSSKAKGLIDAEGRRDNLRASAISFWEVGMLARKQRVMLPDRIDAWRQRVFEYPGFHEIPVTASIAIEAADLPGELHGDPADRLIIATARLTGARLVTQDRAILAYAAAGHVDAVAA